MPLTHLISISVQALTPKLHQWASLVPRPRPAFRRLQYGRTGCDGKLGGAWERGYQWAMSTSSLVPRPHPAQGEGLVTSG